MALAWNLVAAGSLATVVGVPAAAVAETVAAWAEGVAVVASVAGATKHFKNGEIADGIVSMTGAIPGVGIASKAIYDAKYADKAVQYGSRMAGHLYRDVAQAVDAGATWGSGLGTGVQLGSETSDLLDYMRGDVRYTCNGGGGW